MMTVEEEDELRAMLDAEIEQAVLDALGLTIEQAVQQDELEEVLAAVQAVLDFDQPDRLYRQ
jgi:hypothetical protein